MFNRPEAPIRANWDVWVWSREEGTSRPLLHTPANKFGARVSPDGHWMSYTSDQSGRNEVYVQAFPGPSPTWQISRDGGLGAKWAKNGRELFYVNGTQMMAVDVLGAPGTFKAGLPKRLFDGLYGADDTSYDVAGDGRFLMIKNDPVPVTHLILIQNWTEELKQRVPTR